MNGAVYIGLDYGAARVALDYAQIEVTPGLWRDLRDIEAGALAELNRGDP